MIESKIPPPNTIHTIVIAPVVPPPSEQLVTGAEPPPWVGKALKWVFPVAAILFIALIAVPGFLQKWLWMRQLDYAGIFWTLFSVKVALTAGAFASAVAFLWLNLWQANRSGTVQTDYKPLAAAGSGESADQARLKAVALVRHIAARSTALLVGVVSAIFAAGLYVQWDTWLRFHYGGSYGLSDPIFGVD